MCVPSLPTFLGRRLPCSDFSAVFSFSRFSGGVTALLCIARGLVRTICLLLLTSPRKTLSATQATASQSPSVTRDCRPSVRVCLACLDFLLSSIDSTAATEEHHVSDDAGSSLDGESGCTQQPPSSFFEDRRKDWPCNLGDAAAEQDGAHGDRQLAGHRQGDGHKESGECAVDRSPRSRLGRV